MPHVFPDDHGRYRCQPSAEWIGDVWRSDESYGLKYLHSHSKAFYRCRTAGTEARGRTSPAKWMEKVLEPIWLLQKGYADIPE